jgi:hypothetical protein
MRIASKDAVAGVSALVCMAVLGAAPASAHHSSARFDAAQQVAVEGVVTGVRWANPHVYLTVEQTAEASETVEWEVETVGPSALRRLGWSEDTIDVGDRVALQGSPARNGAPSLNLRTLEHSGETINVMALIREYQNPGAAPVTGAAGLDGTWAVLANFALIGPYLPNGPKPPLTDAGAAALAAFDETADLPALQCIESPAPYFMFIVDTKRVATGEDEIRIVGDYEGAERVIHMNVDDHAGATESVHGHSIGRWEGETLVIDTTHFAPHAAGHAFGVPSGAQKHLVERLTRNEDGTRILYSFEVTDPEFLAAPITGETEWAYRPDFELELADCDPVAAQRFAE